MSIYRIFYTQLTLSQKEEAKLREFRQNHGKHHGQIKIRYSKRRKVEDMEFPSVEAVKEWQEAQNVPLEGMDGLLASYVDVYGVCEARDGESQRKLEDFFSAEEVLLL
jgi:hypothetical protein